MTKISPSMRFISKTVPFLAALFFAKSLLSQTAPPTAVKDSMNPALETQIGARLAAVHAELAKIELLLADSTQTGYFTKTLNDSVAATYYRLDACWSTVSSRTVWPPDTTSMAEIADSASTPSWPPMDSTFTGGGGMGGGKSPFSMFRKKSPRTVFSWGFSWGVADVIGSYKPGGDAENPNFDFAQSRHRRFALLLRTRLGKRDTTDNFSFGGGGKFNMRKLRESRDQFRNSKFNLKCGLVFDRVKLEQISDYQLLVDAGKPVFVTDPEIAQSKTNKLTVSYIEVPLLAEAMLTKRIKVEAGPFVGIRTRSRQTVEYAANPFEIKRTRRDALGLRKYNYGLMGGFGFKELYLAAKLDMSNLFDENPNYDFNLLSLGVTLGL